MMKCENCGSISSTSILGLCTSCNEKFEEMRRAEESFSGYYCYGCNKELICGGTVEALIVGIAWTIWRS